MDKEKKTVGIIGGGQLCLMLAQENRDKKLGHKIIALDPSKDCPSKDIVDKLIIGDFKDKDKIFELAKECDVITYEIELANSLVLKEVEKSGKIVAPSPETLFTIQDKFRQKTFFREKNLPVPNFIKVETKGDVLRAGEQFGYPLLLKATQDSYDGRGNFVVEAMEDIEDGLNLFKGRPLMVEEFIDFKMEVSVIAARDLKGNIKTFQVGENIHRDNILFKTIVPPRVSAQVQEKAVEVARRVMEVFSGAGVFGIEMFVTSDDDILINEIAPRVHNSGHHTIEANESSQFEQHMRAITGMELADTNLKSKVIMHNILGGQDYEGEYEVKSDLPDNTTLHMYGKTITKPKRKMGHITVLGATEEDVDEIIKKVRLVPKNE